MDDNALYAGFVVEGTGAGLEKFLPGQVKIAKGMLIVNHSGWPDV